MTLQKNCCCAVGRCCTLDVDLPNADCQDGCIDNISEIDCDQQGGRWQLGTCADVDSCKGTCCVTNSTTGCFIACQTNVTRCECYSDNLAVGVATNWTEGTSIYNSCEYIGCPCTNLEGCDFKQIIIFTEEIYWHTWHCYGCDGCGALREAKSTTVTDFNINPHLAYGCDNTDQVMIDWGNSSYEETRSCDIYSYNQIYKVTRQAVKGILIPPTACSNAPAILIGNDEYEGSCDLGCPSNCRPFWYQCGISLDNYSVPVYINATVGNACGFEDCVPDCNCDPCG